MSKRVNSQPKIVPKKLLTRLNDLSPVKRISRPSIGVSPIFFPSQNNLRLNFSSPKLNFETKPRSSITELLIAKHRNSNSKLTFAVCLNKTVSTRPETVTSPAQLKDTEKICITEENPSKTTPKVTFDIKNIVSEHIGNFITLKELGKGAYAVVKSALSTEDNTQVAIKIYDKLKILTPSRKKNVEREVSILSKLNHPNIIKLFKTIETKNSLNLVMELVNGCSLVTYLKKRQKKRLEENEARRIFRQLLVGLDHIHSQNITHRDIKLENILIDHSNTVKIIDFGFSTCFSNENKVSLFCGTPSYMSPEIVMKKESFGPPVDVWAAGVVLYALLTGCFPFKAPHTRELYYKIEKGSFFIPSHLSSDVGLLLMAMMSLDPIRRPSAKGALEFSWFREKTKNFSVGEAIEVPRVRVSLNSTYEKGKQKVV